MRDLFIAMKEVGEAPAGAEADKRHDFYAGVRLSLEGMLISPEFSPQGANLHIGSAEHVSAFFVHWMDLAAPLGIGGVWLWMFWSQLRQRPLLPVGDPYLQDALESSGGH